MVLAPFSTHKLIILFGKVIMLRLPTREKDPAEQQYVIVKLTNELHCSDKIDLGPHCLATDS